MPSLTKNISLQWDLWIEQYRAFFPTGREDRESCHALIAQAGTFDGATEEPASGGKEYIQLATCQDTRNGQLIACLHIRDALPLKGDPGKETQFGISHIEKERLSKIAVFTQLAVHPDYEKTQAVLVLLTHCIVEVLKAGGQAVLMSCDPGHFSIYKRLGFRPVGVLHKTPEGFFRIPMIFLPDQDYLSIIHSPVLPYLSGIVFAPYRPICEWYYKLVRENSELQTGAAYYPQDESDFEGHHTITEGLSPEGREIFLKNALIIKCREGEVLITENDGGKAFGYIRKGLVKVVIGGKTVVVLGEGDIFGEIAFILHTKRSAKVIAASPDTEVVLFSDSAFNSLAKETDRTVIWRNLARVLAQRVVLTNKLLG